MKGGTFGHKYGHIYPYIQQLYPDIPIYPAIIPIYARSELRRVRFSGGLPPAPLCVLMRLSASPANLTWLPISQHIRFQRSFNGAYESWNFCKPLFFSFFFVTHKLERSCAMITYCIQPIGNANRRRPRHISTLYEPFDFRVEGLVETAPALTKSYIHPSDTPTIKSTLS